MNLFWLFLCIGVFGFIGYRLIPILQYKKVNCSDLDIYSCITGIIFSVIAVIILLIAGTTQLTKDSQREELDKTYHHLSQCLEDSDDILADQELLKKVIEWNEESMNYHKFYKHPWIGFIYAFDYDKQIDLHLYLEK